MTNILRIDSSARRSASVSRQIADRILGRMQPTSIVVRDLAETPVPQVTETWVRAAYTPPDARIAEDVEALDLSDRLIAEVMAADVLLISMPIYNFGIPAALKAWVDQVARVGVTFRFTQTGFEGLTSGKRAIVAVASGGSVVGSEWDMATGHLRLALALIGITDVEVVAADRLAVDPEGTVARAMDAADALAV